MLIANKIPILRRFDCAPLAYPILFKTLVYTALVAVARLLVVKIRHLSLAQVRVPGVFVDF